MKKYILVSALVIVVGLGALLYFNSRTENQTSTINGPSGQNPGDQSSPSEEERNAGNEQKEEIVKDEQKQSDNDSTKKATVIITDAGQYSNMIEVRAFIPDHYQNGTCTITFTKGVFKVSKQTPAYRDASTTICTNPQIKRSEFSATGEWHLRVVYSSKDAQGTSALKTITIK